MDYSFSVCDPSAGCDEDDYDYIVFRAADGEANALTVRRLDLNRVLVQDIGATLEPGNDCTLRDPRTAICRLAVYPGTYSEITLGDRDDVAAVTDVPAQVDPGDGDDDMTVSNGDYAFRDGPGGDRLAVETDATGALSYHGRTEPIRATVDGVADDGAAGEGDNLIGAFTSLVGGGSADVLAAGDAPARLVGGHGDDVLRGGSTDDSLVGGEGADALSGGKGQDELDYVGSARGVHVSFGDGPDDGAPREGDDVAADIETVLGSERRDELEGDERANVLVGRGSRDELSGGAGDDRLNDGGGVPDESRDTIIGGSGSDHVLAGHGDTVELDDGEEDRVRCNETAPRFAFDAADVFAECAAIARLLARRVSGLRASASVRLRCATKAIFVCRGYVTVRERGVALGRRSYRLVPGRTRSFTLRLRRHALRRATITVVGVRRSPQTVSRYRVRAPARR